jgi:tetratricopeptide (TPR) repeat protein
MNRILYVAVDVDDNAFHGHAVPSDQAQGKEFVSKPSAAHLVRALQKIEKTGYQTKICYEAGYLGYSLYRRLVKRGYACDIIAPSMTPKPAGARVNAHGGSGLDTRHPCLKSRPDPLSCLNPHFAKAYNNLGLAFSDQGRFSEAIVQYEKALKLKPHMPEALNNLGIALAKQGRMAEAADRYLMALQWKPAYADAHNNMGVTLEQQGEIQQAIYHFREALRLNPNLAETHVNLGAVLHKKGQFREALAHYKAALRLKPDLEVAHTNAALVLTQWGRYEEAADHLREARRLQPKEPQ